jgi:hypothetical protein
MLLFLIISVLLIKKGSQYCEPHGFYYTLDRVIGEKVGIFFVKNIPTFLNYLNPTAACQTNANKRKNTGITGATSIIGLKIA